MVGGVGAAGTIDFAPTSAADLPAAKVKAEFQVATLKMGQDMMRMQGEAMAKLMEPHKGQHIDARA